MKITARKRTVFWVNLIVLIGLWVTGLIFSPNILMTTGVAIIAAIGTNGVIYIGGSVFDAWQKSKYYRPELDK